MSSRGGGLMASVRETQKANLEKKKQERRDHEAAAGGQQASSKNDSNINDVQSSTDGMQMMSAKECLQQIRAHSTSGICVFDFGPSILWIQGGPISLKRTRYEREPNTQLYELKQKVRELHDGLERERASFEALHASLQQLVVAEAANPSIICDMYSDFYSSMARVIGKAVVETYDPFGGLQLKNHVQFERFNSHTVNEDMANFLHHVVNVLGYYEASDTYVTVNECIARLVGLGFLATYHYSVLVRSSVLLPKSISTLYCPYFLLHVAVLA